MQTRQSAAEAVAAQDEDQDANTTPVVEQRSPQAVIDKLYAARGELDVIFDLITAIKQQQFVSLTHVPTVKDPAVVAREAALRLARRREQLRITAERIRTGTRAAREQVEIADRFYHDLKEIRKEWRVCRRSAASGGNPAGSFYVDLSLPIERGTVSLGSVDKTHVNIVPTAEGRACIVVVIAATKIAGAAAPAAAAAAESAVKLIKGPQNISEELKRRQNYHSWKVIETLLSQEARKGGIKSGATSAAQHSIQAGATVAATEAILRMAAAATAKRALTLTTYYTENINGDEDTAMLDAEANLEEESKKISEKEIKIDHSSSSAEKGWGAKDIETYCSTATSQLEFESRTLRYLAFLCTEAQTPVLIKETRGGTAVASMLYYLNSWLRHAALCYSVDLSLTRQIQNLADVSITATTATFAVVGKASSTFAVEGTEIVNKWIISKGDSGSVGVLAVEYGVLRWYGPALKGVTGQGHELGRAHLENFIKLVRQSK